MFVAILTFFEVYQLINTHANQADHDIQKNTLFEIIMSVKILDDDDVLLLRCTQYVVTCLIKLFAITTFVTGTLSEYTQTSHFLIEFESIVIIDPETFIQYIESLSMFWLTIVHMSHDVETSHHITYIASQLTYTISFQLITDHHE